MDKNLNKALVKTICFIILDCIFQHCIATFSKFQYLCRQYNCMHGNYVNQYNILSQQTLLPLCVRDFCGLYFHFSERKLGSCLLNDLNNSFDSIAILLWPLAMAESLSCSPLFSQFDICKPNILQFNNIVPVVIHELFPLCNLFYA